MENPSVFVLPEPKDGFKATLTLLDHKLPEVQDDEVQLQMKRVGLCGSDIHYWTHGGIGRVKLESPMILGHEASGIITKIGKNVKNVKIGDRVAIEPGYPKTPDEFSKTGRYNLSDVYFCATPPDNGCMSKFYNHKAAFCYKIPDSMSFEEAALVEPLSVGIHATNRANVGLGSNVLIIGAGPMGIVNLLVARAKGAEKVILVDINQGRLDTAMKLGATKTVLSDIKSTPEELAQNILVAFGKPEHLKDQKIPNETNLYGPEITIECSGAEPSIQAAIYSMRNGGQLVTVGRSRSFLANIPLNFASSKEIDIKGVFRYTNTWPTAIKMINSGIVNVGEMITHRYKFSDQWREALEATRTSAGLKVMVAMDE